MRQGRHVEERHRRRALSPSSVIAVLAALCTAGAIALSMSPAQASTTVPVQLTLSGVASPDNPTGGATVGVHPGDSVVLKAAAIPTAGAPAGLSGALSNLVAGVAGLQVKILAGNHLPGLGGRAYTLGAVQNCGGKASLPLRSLAKGTYSFQYVVQKVSLLTSLLGAVTGCKQTTVTPTQDQLGALTKNNVKVTDNAVYSGNIVVATNPPSGQIGLQLPKQSISVKAGPIHTSINLPGATVGVPNPLPSVTKILGNLPGAGGGKGGSNGGSNGGPNVKYTPPALTVPERVMPHAVNFGGAQGTGGAAYVAPGAGDGANGGGHVVAQPRPSTTAAPVANPSNVANAQPGKTTVDLSSKDQLGGQQLPVLLAILAILALSLVTATYARMVLLRRH
jgi:hypothetical protein